MGEVWRLDLSDGKGQRDKAQDGHDLDHREPILNPCTHANAEDIDRGEDHDYAGGQEFTGG